jgi:hypothetical protein
VSYDFHLFRPEPGVELEAAAEAALEYDSAADSGDPDPGNESRKQRLVAALREQDPTLEVFLFDYAKIAARENISEEEARRRHRDVELNTPDGVGVQISLFDDTAAVTVPYWHSGSTAVDVFNRIWQYLAILEKEGGYRTQDPQVGRVLDLAHDFQLVAGCYGHGVGCTQGLALGARRRKPWWKFW